METREIKMKLSILVNAEESEGMDLSDFEDAIQEHLDSNDDLESVIRYYVEAVSDHDGSLLADRNERG